MASNSKASRPARAVLMELGNQSMGTLQCIPEYLMSFAKGKHAYFRDLVPGFCQKISIMQVSEEKFGLHKISFNTRNKAKKYVTPPLM